MVEMFDVLALMGLLVILGAKGYDIAMERINAMNIINEINRRSVILLTGSTLVFPELPI